MADNRRFFGDIEVHRLTHHRLSNGESEGKMIPIYFKSVWGGGDDRKGGGRFLWAAQKLNVGLCLRIFVISSSSFFFF